MEFCLFCNGPEKNYTPDKHVEFLCSTCVQLLLGAEQEDLKRAYAKAEKLGFKRKVTALKMFIIKEDEDGKQFNERRAKRNITKRADRGRAQKVVRPDKKSIDQFKNQRASALLES